MVSLLTEGQYTIAATLAQKMTLRFPFYWLGWKVLGAALRRMDRSADALAPLQKVVELMPGDADAHYNFGNVLSDQGRLGEAVICYRRAVFIQPNFAEAHNNLGNTLKSLGQLSEAEVCYKRALHIQPNSAVAHFNLGGILDSMNRLEEAEACYRMALAIKPEFAEAHNDLGASLQQQYRLDEAEASYRRALQINPEFAAAHNNLSVVFSDLGRLSEAEVSARRALEIKPDYAEAYLSLGNTRKDLGQLDGALTSYHQALEFKPDLAEAHSNLGLVLRDLGQFDDAVACCRRALEIEPGSAEAHCNLGTVMRDLGQLDNAVASYRLSLEIKPDYAKAHSNLLFTLTCHMDKSREEVFAVCRGYGERFGRPHFGKLQTHSNSHEARRRLRIGYVSPDFCRHAVAYFAEPILACHDKSQVEIFCYVEVKKEDEYTGRFRQLADHWCSTVGLSDDAVAQMIRDHQIDILVDLAGHTKGNRLLVFARKPAPIQLTYLGYAGSTGLSAMDYRITDRHADNVGVADTYYTEQLLRLPDSFGCYRPSAAMPPPSVLPALSRGFITFGSFNNFNKIDQRTLTLWAGLLRSLPTARLMMLTVPEGESRLCLSRYFTELGIDAQRLEFHGRMPAVEFYRKFLEVDIALDPVSVGGGTTTCESLWMGVPVIAGVGERVITRLSYSFLCTAGMADFAAFSAEDYIRIAVHFANNLPLLAEIRAGLRAKVAASPLVDEAGFTRNLEKLYREIWSKWCSAI